MDKKTVIITGIKGQGASYAADLYLKKGFKVVGIYRRCSTQDFTNIKHLESTLDFELYEADICDSSSISELLSKYQPYAVLNFAAMSHVGSSYTQPIITAEVDYLAVAKLLEAIRIISPKTKFWQASTSERFGDNKGNGFQDETTEPSPISPYACAKLASEYLIKAYRKTYGLHASYSIMFNYESPRRSREFVTRKITDYIGRTYNMIPKTLTANSVEDAYKKAIELGYIPKLKLGNLDSYRSWTHCSDVIKGVFAQIELDEPKDYLFGVEETHSIKDFLDEAFGVIDIKDWSFIVEQDKKFMRPSDVGYLKPNSQRAQKELGWTPMYSFKELVIEMVFHDISLHSNK